MRSGSSTTIPRSKSDLERHSHRCGIFMTIKFCYAFCGMLNETVTADLNWRQLKKLNDVVLQKISAIAAKTFATRID